MAKIKKTVRRQERNYYEERKYFFVYPCEKHMLREQENDFKSMQCHCYSQTRRDEMK